MPTSSVIVPIVTRFHWDDLTNQFNLVITFELKTPLGVFRKEERFTLADLASVVAEIYQILAYAGSEPGVYKAGFPVGDFAALSATMAATVKPDEVVVAPPTPYDAGADEPPAFETWDGVEGIPEGYTAWGVPH